MDTALVVETAETIVGRVMVGYDDFIVMVDVVPPRGTGVTDVAINQDRAISLG